MKKKLFMLCISIMTCIASLQSYAQALSWSADNFLRTYPVYTSGTQFPQKIETALDGSTFTAGTFIIDSIYERKLCIIKRNAAGDSITSFIDDDPGFEPGGPSYNRMNNYVNDMLIDFNNNIYVLGTTSDSVHISGLNYKGTSVLYKFNSSLTLVWKRTISIADMFSMIFDASGNICLNGTTKNNGDGTGLNIITKKFDNSGTQLWSTLYASPGSFDDQAADIASDGFGNIYVTGNSVVAGNGKTVRTIKYNSSGQQQWVSSYNTFTAAGAKDQAVSIAVSPSGNAYVVGLVAIGQYQISYRNTLIKYDTNGNEQWHKTPSNMTEVLRSYVPVKVRLDINEHVYVVAVHKSYSSSQFSNYGKQVQVRRYTAGGKMEWSLVRDSSDAYDFDVTPFGSIYIAGSSGYGPKFCALKISSTGSELWQDSYEPVIFSNQSAFPGYATCVNINPYNPFTATFGGVTQVSQPGSIYSNQWSVRQYNTFGLKLSSPSTTENITELSIRVFPNPTTDILQLKTDNDLSGALISIHNLSGETVKTFTATDSDKNINVADLKPGFYFIEVIKGNSIITKKFLKE